MNTLNKDLQHELKQQSKPSSNRDDKSSSSLVATNNSLRQEKSHQSGVGAIETLIRSTKRDNEPPPQQNSSTLAQLVVPNKPQTSKQQQPSVRFQETNNSTSNNNLALTNRSAASSNSNNQLSTESIQRLVESFHYDQTQVNELRVENESLKFIIDDLRKQLMNKELKNKQDLDLFQTKIKELLAKDLKSNEEIEALSNLMKSTNQNANESVIKEQQLVVESLQNKCKSYEQEIKSLKSGSLSDLNKIKIKDQTEEIVSLKNIVHRLSIELSWYKAKYPSPSVQNVMKFIVKV